MNLFIIWLIHLSVIGFSAWGVYRHWVATSFKPHFWPSLLLKVLGGIALGLVYKYFYSSGDTWAIYADSQMVLQELGIGEELFSYLLDGQKIPDPLLAKAQAVGHKAMWMSMLAGLVGSICAHNYWLMGLYFSLFSFYGMGALVQALHRFFHIKPWILALCLLYWPGLLLWSGGLLKESLMMGSMGWLVTLFLHLHFNNPSIAKRLLGLLWAVINAWILFKVKFYYFAPLLICLGGIWLSYIALKLPLLQKNKAIAIVILIFIGISLVWLGQSIYPALALSQFPEQIIKNQIHIYRLSSSSSGMIIYEGIEATWGSLLSCLPQAFWEGLMRPYIWEEGHWLKKAAALEGLCLLLAIALFVRVLVKNKFTIELPKSLYNRLFLGFTLLYISIMGSLLPLAAPNIGALMRYRIGYWPILLLLLLMIGTKVVDKRRGKPQ